MSSTEGKNGNKLATLSFALGITGAVTSILVVGFPISIIAVIVGRKALKIGNFGYYESQDDDGGSTTMSYSFRAYMGLIFGGIGCLVGLGMCAYVIGGL